MASSPSPPPNSSPNVVPPPSPTTLPPPTTAAPSPQAASPPPQPDASPPSLPATPPQSSPPQSAPPPVPAAPPPRNLSPPPSSPLSNITPPPPQPVSSSPSPPPPPSNEARPPTPVIPPPPTNDPPPPVVSPPSVPPIASPAPPITTLPPGVPPPPVNPPPPPLIRPTSSPPPPPPSPTSNPPTTSPSPPPPPAPKSLSPPPPSTPQRSPPPPAPVPPSDPPPQPPASQPILSPPPPINLSPPPQKVVLPPPPADSFSPPPSLPSTSSSNNGISTVGAVAIGVAIGILVIGLIGFAIWCCKRRGKKDSQSSKGHVTPAPAASSATTDSTVINVQSSAPLVRSSLGSDFIYIEQEQGGLGNSRTWFSYDELDKATNGFSSENLIGEGGFGSVYKGCLPDGKEIAVKVLKVGQGHGDREFKAEVEIISRIHHRNLVSLVGCCIADDRKLLVYDYVPNNTLHFHLHGDGIPALDWAKRVRIAAGAARGIAYLHEDCHPRIIHRDIKSSNILLDNNFEARVSDFGLAKLAQDARTHITTRVMGTFGYMAPDYALSGKLTEKSDLYSFGVVLLELITGRKPVDTSQPLGDESLVEWARPLLNRALNNEEFESLADPRLGKNYDESEMFRMIEAAAACVRHSAAKRPRMGQIVRAFDDMTTRDLTNRMSFSESEVFHTAQQSLETRLFRRMQFSSKDNSTENLSRSSTECFSRNNTEYFSQSNTENFTGSSFSSSK